MFKSKGIALTSRLCLAKGKEKHFCFGFNLCMFYIAGIHFCTDTSAVTVRYARYKQIRNITL